VRSDQRMNANIYTKNPHARTVILPCETKSREFESKMLLACVLAERGWRCIVGSRNEIHFQLHRFPQSTYLGKDVRFSSAKVLRILRLLGHRFVAMDEEAQFYISRESYRAKRVDEFVFSHAEALFAWGPENATAWSETKSYNGASIFTTGNGRIDLLRPEFSKLYLARVEALRKTYGRFVLFNTNFGSINHFLANLSTNVSEDETKSVSRAHDNGYLFHRRKILNAFAEIMPELAREFPGTTFVLRPHPGESVESWEKILSGYKNVFVRKEGSVIPWLMAADVLIHNGCTTALEAYVLRRPVISYQPIVSEEFDLHLPNALGFFSDTLVNLKVQLRDILSGQLGFNQLHTLERDELLAKHISATQGRLATDLLADGLDKISSGSELSRVSLPSRIAGTTFAKARALLKAWHRNNEGHKSSIAYMRHRFPQTELPEVRDYISAFHACLGRFSDIKVSTFDANIFVVEK
jgi:surface carbohydrate biosynthesis protein